MSHKVRVNLGVRGYDVLIGDGVFGRIGPVLDGLFGKPRSDRLFIGEKGNDTAAWIQDETQRVLWEGGWGALSACVEANERHKSLSTLDYLTRFYSAYPRFGRDSILFAVGGGIIGDIGGFVAATYKRGLRWVNIPTTLLAMVDASVGGKTGVNIIGQDGTIHKNMVGVFHQPSLVVIDTRWLATLPPRQVRCGMAECLKHALLCRSVPGFDDTALFEFTRGLIRRAVDVTKDANAAAELIARNVALKARVVERDEFETAPDDEGGRALLNLGHTFAHVLEGLPDLDLLHGEAVGLGLVAAAHTARALGRVSAGYVAGVEELVAGVGLETRISGLPHAELLIERMRADKKSVAGTLRLIVPQEPSPGQFGHAAVVRGPDAAAVAAGWDALRASPTV
mgnify:CR=1 FL=1